MQDQESKLRDPCAEICEKKKKKVKKIYTNRDTMFAILNMWNYKRDEARRHVDDMKDDSNTMVQVI